VIAIIGILVALLLPAIQAAREAARRAQCTNNLKQVGLAVLNYEDAKKELPYGSTWNRPATEKKGNWIVCILPYLEEQALGDQYDTTKYSNEAPNLQLAQTTILPTLICPTDEIAQNPVLPDRRSGAGSHNPSPSQGLWYTGSMGPTIPDKCEFISLSDPEYVRKMKIACLGSGFGTLNPPNDSPRLPASPAHRPGDTDNCAGVLCRRHLGIELQTVTDGLSNTFLAGETLPGHWVWNCVFCDNFPVSSTHIPLNTMEFRPMPPAFPEAENYFWRISGFKSMHTGGAQFVMCDGSVHFVEETIDYLVYNMLGSRRNGDGSSGDL
jgi:prepilin-type processing-associated H-X9-DG protein